MAEKAPMVIYADEKENVPCPKAFGEVPLRSCKDCDYKWAFGSENGVRSVDCFYPMCMPAERLQKFTGFRDACYRKGTPYRVIDEDKEFEEILDRLMAGLHPHQRSELE